MKKTEWRRSVSALLAALLVVGRFPVSVAAGDTAGLCAHHEAHTDCGYREAAEGSPCAHEHDGSCGYDEEAGTPCAHSHDAACGYVCELCAAGSEETTEPGEPSEPGEPEVVTVDAWEWVGGEELTDGELALPGASAENTACFEDIVPLLPYAVSTAHGVLALGWSCDGYPAGGAWEGSFSGK